MRQIRGQQARWALVGAIALAIMTTSSVMGESARSIDLRANREARPAPTLTADLDRSAVAPYRELARVRAVAALAAPVDVPAAPAKAHPPAIVRNHLWIPSLGISRRVYFYFCGDQSPLSNIVYRWGCGGTNNVYLLGHAWGVFKALHDAYTSGRLRTGMVAMYADRDGHVTRYQVTAWQVVPANDSAWAMAAQSRPSMTLQTCVGTNSDYRLDVRLVSF